MAAINIDVWARGKAGKTRKSRSRGGSSLLCSDPATWIEKHFFIPELRAPMPLFPYQKQALRHAISRDAAGLFNYSTIVWSDIKKSAKSCVAAGLALWMAFQVDETVGWGSAYIIANDLKQADSRISYYMRRAVMLNPRLAAVCKITNYKITLPNRTFIEAIPIDPTGEAGANADFVAFSELWGAHSKAQQQMWTESTLSPTKFGQSLRWVETYAGYSGRSPLLERLYDQAVVQGRHLDPNLEIYDNRTARIFALWNQTPRLPWQTPEYYAQELASLGETEFLRVHRNTWSEGGPDRFLASMSYWEGCKEDDLPPLQSYTPVILSADGAISNDSFGVVAVARHPTRRNAIQVVYRREWKPKEGKPLDFDDIEEEIAAWCSEHNVIVLVYDPYAIHQMMTSLGKGHTLTTGPHKDRIIKVNVEAFNQGGPRLSADKGLLDRITRREIAHRGEADLHEHLDNADKLIMGERKLRIVKRTDAKKIDLAVALSMAAFKIDDLPEESVPALGLGSAKDSRAKLK